MLNPSICYSLTRYNDEWSQNHMQYVKLLCQLALTFSTDHISSTFLFCHRCCLRIFICSNSQSSYSYHNTCCLELRSNIAANLSSGRSKFLFFFNSISSIFFWEWQNELALILLGTVGAKHLIPIIYWQLTFTTELNYFKCVSLGISDY